jgi:hypothetical protein
VRRGGRGSALRREAVLPQLGHDPRKSAPWTYPVTSGSIALVWIDAPANAVRPWLVQMGQGGGGLYSYETLENFAGLDYHNADPTELPSSAPPRQRR